MPGKRKRGWKGLTLPGYNYLGPFNSEDNGEPTNAADRAADRHDKRYKSLSDQHGYLAPYVKYNDADEAFLRDIAGENDYGARIARQVFRFKKRLHQFGLLGSIHDPIRHGRPANQNVPDTTSSVHNIAPTTQEKMSKAMVQTGSGNEKGLSETPIDRPRGSWDIYRGPPTYTFASLPFLETRNISANLYARDYVFRMTSPYDPSVSISTMDINTGAGTATWQYGDTDASDASAAKTRWWDFYASMYKYYHTLSCRYHITIENLTNDRIWVHKLFCNDTTPPVGATNDDMLCWSDCESHLLGSHAIAITSSGAMEANDMDADAVNDEDNAINTAVNYETGNHVQRKGSLGPILHLSGEYRPGDFAREVRLDSEVENWTAVTANPSLTERLLIRFRHFDQAVGDNDANSYNRALAVVCHVKLEYLVEFKELKDGLKWPVAKQPISFTVNQDIN